MRPDLLDAYDTWHFFRGKEFTWRQWAFRFGKSREEFKTSRRKWARIGLEVEFNGTHYSLAPDYERQLSDLLDEQLPATGPGPESFLRRALAIATELEQEGALQCIWDE